jgi:hypothetical protein
VSALASPGEQAVVRASSVEVHDDFSLAFVEFDDQGRFWNREQLDLVEKTLEEANRVPDTSGVAIIVFAHGWRHGCEVCDQNVTCFRTFLKQINSDATVAAGLTGGAVKRKRVVGIYAGWRGLSEKIQPFEDLSFWARKRVAQRIGEQDLVELLTRVELFARRANAEDSRRVRLVLIGHSLGGTMVYGALANVLKVRALQAAPRPGEPAGPDSVIRGFGDLVLLLNPAFEASLYAPLHDIETRFGRFSPKQTPVLVMVASETDKPNRTWFPMGRQLDTLFQKTGDRGSRKEIVTAVGNYEPFWTHRLTAIEPPAHPPKGKGFLTSPNCSCELPLHPISEAEARDLGSILAGKKAAAEAPAGMTTPYGRALLTALKPMDPNQPFWVVRASNDVMQGHSGIFTTFLMDFVRRVIIEASVRSQMR